MTDSFEEMLLGKVAENTPRFPLAHYDPDGDCIEFIMTDESYYGERIDTLVTVYYGRESGEVVGSLIKGVRAFIAKQLERCPGFKIEIHDGRIRLKHLFTAAMWSFDADPKGTKEVVYQKLRDAADKSNAEAEVCVSTA